MAPSAARRSASAVASSAGKKASMAGSASVSSSGVPRTVTALVKATSPAVERRRSGTGEAAEVLERRRPRCDRHRLAAKLVDQARDRRIAGRVELPPRARQQMRPPFLRVDDPLADAVGMSADPRHVDRRLEQGRCEAFEQAVDRLPGGAECRTVQRPCRKGRGEPGGEQQPVALA
jgi:hypothetical protein